MQPQLVQATVNKEGEVVEKLAPQKVRQVISPDTASQVALILESVVSGGTGRNAYIEGYRVAGKTGTAQKAGAGGYQEGQYVASFTGFAPANDPKLAALVVIDEPQGYPYYGGTIAAPIFKRVMEDSLRYIGVPRQFDPVQEENNTEEQEEVLVPDVLSLSADKAIGAVKAAGLKPKTVGDGQKVIQQVPIAQTRVKEGTEILLRLSGSSEQASEVAVPDVTGKRIPQAARLLEALGLVLKPQGSGVAVEQRPVPGTKVITGTEIHVIFKDKTPDQPTLGP